MNKTTYRHDWTKGHTICKRLSRSFDSLEEAKAFAQSKNAIDIYTSKGRYKVEWLKIIDNNTEDFPKAL